MCIRDSYNLVGDRALQHSLLAGRGPIDLAHWYAHKRLMGTTRSPSLIQGEHRVRRRVHPELLFGESAVAISAKMTDAVFLRRTAGSDFKLTEITPDTLARMGSN